MTSAFDEIFGMPIGIFIAILTTFGYAEIGTMISTRLLLSSHARAAEQLRFSRVA
jgi:hypothetical protein